MDLRVGGVYCLPNGRELIVLRKLKNGKVSYGLTSPTHHYEIGDDGRLICNGNRTAWDIGNLSDTGRSVGVERLKHKTAVLKLRQISEDFCESALDC